METGKVTKLIAERGFGFIHDGYGAQFFFHASNTQNFDDLAVGDGVAFDIGTFIHDGYGAQFFFHASNTQNFDDLAVGDGVAFDIGTGRDGRTCAVDVRRAKHDAPRPDAVSAQSLFIKQRNYDQ